jgi:ribose transport system substrate-binding protein
MTMNNPFYSVIDEELRLVIESRGDILLTRDPALDQERQNEEIRDLLHENIDLLVLNPVDYREIEPALQEAQKAGVPTRRSATRIW